MKVRTATKASMALGLVTTGADIVTTQSANAEVASTLKAGQLAKINVSTSAITTTAQAVSTEQNHTINPEQATKSSTENVLTSLLTQTEQTPRSSIQKTTQPTSSGTTQSLPNAQSQSTQPTPSVITPPSSNVEAPQPTSPATKQAQREINPKFKGLKSHYTKSNLEFRSKLGIIIKEWTAIRFMNIVPDYFIYKIALVGKDDKKYGEGVHRYIGVFTVLGQNKYGVDKCSVGSITKADRKKVDYETGISITKEDKEGTVSHDVSEYKITKEEISLKKLDLKSRRQLIEQHNSYSNIGSEAIAIKMKNGEKYTFELHKKLQQHRIADVIGGTNIDGAEVNPRSS